MSLEDAEQMDISHKLFQMAEGTDLDRKLDDYIDKLME